MLHLPHLSFSAIEDIIENQNKVVCRKKEEELDYENLKFRKFDRDRVGIGTIFNGIIRHHFKELILLTEEVFLPKLLTNKSDLILFSCFARREEGQFFQNQKYGFIFDFREGEHPIKLATVESEQVSERN